MILEENSVGVCGNSVPDCLTSWADTVLEPEPDSVGRRVAWAAIEVVRETVVYEVPEHFCGGRSRLAGVCIGYTRFHLPVSRDNPP